MANIDDLEIGSKVIDGQGDEGVVTRLYVEDGADYATVEYEDDVEWSNTPGLDWLVSDLTCID